MKSGNKEINMIMMELNGSTALANNVSQKTMKFVALIR